ncbi:mucin-7-like [Argopecten irradians]|uniref:mucin-7-like n=1 Tax=Argopecten irradians TaxID=31199 RepID=UPI0037158C2D
MVSGTTAKLPQPAAVLSPSKTSKPSPLTAVPLPPNIPKPPPPAATTPIPPPSPTVKLSPPATAKPSTAGVPSPPPSAKPPPVGVPSPPTTAKPPPTAVPLPTVTAKPPPTAVPLPPPTAVPLPPPTAKHDTSRSSVTTNNSRSTVTANNSRSSVTTNNSRSYRHHQQQQELPSPPTKAGVPFTANNSKSTSYSRTVNTTCMVRIRLCPKAAAMRAMRWQRSMMIPSSRALSNNPVTSWGFVLVEN